MANEVVRTDMKNSNEVFQQILLKAVKNASVFEQAGLVLKAKITGHDYVSWFRVTRLDPGTPTQLQDGVNPAATAVATEKYTAQIGWYGAYAKISTAAKKIDPVKIVAGFTKAIGELARETREIIIRNAYLSNSSNTYYANAVAGRTNVAATISLTDLKRLFRTMEKAGCEKITKIVKAGAGQNTYPIEACYLMYVTPDQAMDIKGLSGFTKTAEYSNPDVAFEGEFGACAGWRFISSNFMTGAVITGIGSSVTTGMQYTGSNCDVHRAIAIGAEGLGVADLDGGIENIIMSEEQVGGPLKQFSTTGYKMAMTTKVVNTNAIAILESTVSA